MKAVIAGATGLVGSHLLSELILEEQVHQIISLVRRPSGVTHPKLLEIICPDFSKMTDYKEMLQGKLYYCTLGTTIKEAGSQAAFEKVDLFAVHSFAEIAAHHQCQSFSLVSASGANANSMIFYNRTKARAEDELKKLNLNSLKIYRPGLLIGERKTFRRGERFFIQCYFLLEKILPRKVKKMIATPVDHLAKQIVKHSFEVRHKIAIFESIEI